MRLLLAEDEKELSNALVTILKLKGYDVDAAYDGEMAQEMILPKQALPATSAPTGKIFSPSRSRFCLSSVSPSCPTYIHITMSIISDGKFINRHCLFPNGKTQQPI